MPRLSIRLFGLFLILVAIPVTAVIGEDVNPSGQYEVEGLCGGPGQVSCLSRPPCHDPGYRPTFPLTICQQKWYSEEPDCDCDVVVSQQPPRGPVSGIADVHAHQFSNLAFGGAAFWGRVFDERGINEALSWCDFTWDFGTVTTIDFLPTEVPYLGHEVHFDPGAGILSLATEEGGLHHASGAGPFAGWPKWNTTTHQQMYYRWLERAYKGGLRLMVMLAVNNEVLCELPIVRRKVIGVAGYNCDDMYAVDRQLERARELEDFIDRENDGELDGDGWYRIVESPHEARKVIRDGKMAIVLGIEVDGIFGCEVNCDAATIDTELERYHNLGVRHLYPIHLYNNALGGSAIYNELWPYVSPLATSQLMPTVDCEDVKPYLTGPLADETAVYDFKLGVRDFMQGLLNELAKLIGYQVPVFDPVTTGHCTPRGLTPAGNHLIEAMIDKRMIIDVDHMSLLMLDKVLETAQSEDYPVISSHSFLYDRPITEHGVVGARNEAQRTPLQIEIIRDLGGIVAPLNPRKSGSSTRDYVHIYRYIVDKMKGGPYGSEFAAIGFGSDWGGMFLQTAPRCPGPDGCPAQTPPVCPDFYEENPANIPPGCEPSDYPELDYPFQAVGVGGEFRKQETGDRTFDFNTDGLAHVGLLPDFIKDLTNVGLTEEDLEPLFDSAEAYIRMWEKIHGGPPTMTPVIDGIEGTNGWYISDVTVRWESDELVTGNPILESEGCEPVTIDYDTPGVTLTCWAATVGGEAESSVTIKRDTVAPVVACTADPLELWPPTRKMVPVTVATTFTDSLSGPGTISLTSATSSEPDAGLGRGDPPNDIEGFELGSSTMSGALRAQRGGGGPGRTYTLGYTGYDLAGNTASCSTIVSVPHDRGKSRR
jgi:microsomal dipeptidase-like Zn-dependent dipeptidase